MNGAHEDRGLLWDQGRDGQEHLEPPAGLWGVAAWGGGHLVVHTAAGAPERHQGRLYHYFDGREPAHLYAVLERAQASEGGLCVIDGAGNCPGVSAILAKAADCVLIPCGIGGQDATLALADLEQLPGAWLIINRWPMLPKHPRRAKAEAYIAQLPRERILCRLGESAAVDRFTESDRALWTHPSQRVTNAARRLYLATTRERLASKEGSAYEKLTDAH